MDWLACITENKCFYCAVRTEYLSIILVSRGIWKVNDSRIFARSHVEKGREFIVHCRRHVQGEAKRWWCMGRGVVVQSCGEGALWPRSEQSPYRGHDLRPLKCVKWTYGPLADGKFLCRTFAPRPFRCFNRLIAAEVLFWCGSRVQRLVTLFTWSSFKSPQIPTYLGSVGCASNLLIRYWIFCFVYSRGMLREWKKWKRFRVVWTCIFLMK